MPRTKGSKMTKCRRCKKNQPKKEFEGISNLCNTCYNSQEYRNETGAHNAVNTAVLEGRLVRPFTCENCKKMGLRIEGHHHLGYEPEHWLDIQWLCSKCHHKTFVRHGIPKGSKDLKQRTKRKTDDTAV